VPSRRYSIYFPVLFLVADVLCLNFSILWANDLRFGAVIHADDGYLSLHLLLIGLWLFVFFSAGLHDVNREQRLLEHINKVLSALVINLAVVFALWFATKPDIYSRQHLFYTYLIFTVSILSWRFIWYYFIRYSRTKGYNLRNVIVVGNGDLADEIIYYIDNNKEIGYNYVGLFDDESSDKRLGSLSDVESYVERNDVDIMFCLLNKLEESRMNELIHLAEGNLIKVKILSQFSRLGNQNLSVQNYGPIPVLNVNAIPLDSKANQFVKRLFDIVFSLLFLLFVLSWLIPIIGLLIRIESKGPIFFKQLRHGLGNKPFLCWKFRTMVVNNESDTKQATKNDARITKMGAIMRKTSIDELPQFVNVFLGDMSVVGPRPHPIKLNESFQPTIEKFWQRHAVKPGITGLAQAKGFRGETAEFSDMSGRVRLDRFYVKNWSLLLDFKIITLTITSILKGSDNAY
jgi:putative colanic acid biosysnthesis UDP-glucose lipid carrier transferase